VKKIDEFPPGSVITYGDGKPGLRNGWTFKKPLAELGPEAFTSKYSFTIKPGTPCVILGNPWKTEYLRHEYLVIPMSVDGTVIQYFTNPISAAYTENIWYEV
jgi:hypothetical protein